MILGVTGLFTNKVKRDCAVSLKLLFGSLPGPPRSSLSGFGIPRRLLLIPALRGEVPAFT